MATQNLFDTTAPDPTIEALRKAYEAKEGVRTPSRRLGGSSVGQECIRKSWLGFRWVSPVVIGSQGLMAINDGHRSERVLIDMLRAVPGVELYTEDEVPGSQITFDLIDGHFVGKLDGVILGLLQAPVTPHVWEAKAVNQKKFDNLKSQITKVGEKQALEQWDGVYFAQAQTYMHGMGLTRHYLTVATPGVRDIIGVRTEYQADKALMFVNRGKRIIYDNRAPSRLSLDPAFFGCKFCDHAGSCHGADLPQVNCRTCTHASAVVGGGWTCAKFGQGIDYETQQAACQKHRFHPDMINGKAVQLDDNGDVHYELNNGYTYVDGDKKDKLENPMVPF